MDKGKLTISRWTSNGGVRDGISIEITDKLSGLDIITIDVTPYDFGMAVTGLSAVPVEIKRKPTGFIVNNIGKKRETKSIFVNKPEHSLCGDNYKTEIRVRLVSEMRKPEWEGWDLFSDGTSSQQPGEKHRAIMWRFVEAKEGK